MEEVRGVRGHDLSALRRLNTTVVLRSLRRQGPQTLAQLGTTTGLSRPTLELLTEDLVTRGWLVEEAGNAVGRPGRPARCFRFRGEAGCVVGVDIGLHRVVLMLSDLSGGIDAVACEDVDPAMDGVGRLAFLRTRIEQFLLDHNVRRDVLWGVGVGVPGVVDEGGRLVSVVVPEWTGLDLARKFTDVLPCRVLVENDVNLATLAEHWRGAARLADDVVCVLVGRRSSCGVLLNGRLHRGRRGGAGELGLLPQLGLSHAHEALRWDGERRNGESEVEALARAAGAGDTAAVAVLDRYAARLAPGVAALVLTVDPELIVLTGGMAPAGPSLVPLLADHLRDITLHVPRIAVSALGERGVALGAVRKALDDVDAALTDASGPLPSAAR